MILSADTAWFPCCARQMQISERQIWALALAIFSRSLIAKPNVCGTCVSDIYWDPRDVSAAHSLYVLCDFPLLEWHTRLDSLPPAKAKHDRRNTHRNWLIMSKCKAYNFHPDIGTLLSSTGNLNEPIIYQSLPRCRKKSTNKKKWLKPRNKKIH